MPQVDTTTFFELTESLYVIFSMIFLINFCFAMIFNSFFVKCELSYNSLFTSANIF